MWVKFRLYATLAPLDNHYEKILRIQGYHLEDGFRFNQESFNRNIEIAKQIVQDVEVVTLGEVLSPFLDERDGVKGEFRGDPQESRLETDGSGNIEDGENGD